MCVQLLLGTQQICLCMLLCCQAHTCVQCCAMSFMPYSDSGQITEQESLFTYPSGMGYSDFYFPNHIAPLLSEVVANAPDEIKTMCNDNEQCIFDAVQTNNPEIGMGTLDSIMDNANDVMIASKTIYL